MSLNEQAQEILRIAEQHGVEQNFFFLTTFKRYQVQLQILNDLEKTIKEDGTLVTKEYVKGRKNVYSHPAISDYNRTTDSANKTVSTLMKIITSLRKDDVTEDDSEILGYILTKIKDIAASLGIDNGYRVVINCGEDGQQTVRHLHVHILGKRKMTWPPG